MPVVQLPDGTLVQLPDSPEAGLSLLDKGKLIAETAMQNIARPLARGALNVGQGIDASLRGSPLPLGRMYEAVTGMAGMQPPNAEATLPTPQNETKPETYSRRMLEGLPTAAMGGSSALAMAIPSMLGPVAGQAAGDFTKGVSPKLAPIADVLANMLPRVGLA